MLSGPSSLAGVYIFFKYSPPPFQVIWGRFSRHNIRVASQKEEEGKKNGEEGKEKGEEGKKEGKGKKKDAQGREENIFKGAGEGFQQYYVLKTFPSTLKDEVKGRKKRERGRKKMRREGKKIFSKVLGKVFNNVMP